MFLKISINEGGTSSRRNSLPHTIYKTGKDLLDDFQKAFRGSGYNTENNSAAHGNYLVQLLNVIDKDMSIFPKTVSLNILLLRASDHL